MNPAEPQPLYLSATSALPPTPRLGAALDSGLRDAWASTHDLHRAGRSARDVAERSTSILKESISERLGGHLGRHRWLFTVSMEGALHHATHHVVQGTRREATTLYYGAIETAIAADAARIAADNVHAQSARPLPVSPLGRYDLDYLAQAQETDPGPIVAQTSNTEIGTRQNAARLRDIASTYGMPWIADVTGDLAYGGDIGSPDVVVGAASAWGGPAEVAFCAIAPGVPWVPGPTPAPLPQPSPILLLGAAISLQDAAQSDGAIDAADAAARLRRELPHAIEGCDVAGDLEHSLPHVLTVSFLYCEGLRLVEELDRRGVLVGSGSACTNDSGVASHVLEATGRLSHGNVRFGVPPSLAPTMAAHHDRVVAAVSEAVAVVRAETGAPL